MAREELLVADREVVDAVMRFSDKMPTKGLIRVYNSVHPIIDIEGIFLYFWVLYCVWVVWWMCVVVYRSHGADGKKECNTFPNTAKGESD